MPNYDLSVLLDSDLIEDFLADPYDFQVAALMLIHRASFATMDKATHDQLFEVADEYHQFGEMLGRLTCQEPPWDSEAENAVTPSEVFMETPDLIGYTQSIPSPSIGMGHTHFRLSTHAEAASGQFAPTPEMSGARAVLDLVQHPDRRWQVLHVGVAAPFRRQGLATMLYNQAEEIMGIRIYPSGWLSEAAYAFWLKRNPELVGGHRRVDFLPGLWVSPLALLTLRTLLEAKAASAQKRHPPPS